ncbi:MULTISPECIES: DoxX family protein [unclassified Streptomyces]|uniref:DoxX family protein n=1 Tax=unclassified Streptomyces TaxID=2593676 RepID=UPI00044905DF|nr:MULTISPECIES: DoxX family protein [unclassified Streptomyces]EXU63699.1 hypothetical protein Z951_34790 [Streptomyces sp. PRh5]
MPNPLLMLDPRKPPLTPRNTLDDAALLILRLTVGGLLVIHGFQGLGNPGHRIALSRGFGVPLPEVASWLSILGEIGTSVTVVAGLLTRLAAVLMAVLMATTWLTSSLGEPLIGGSEPGLTHENSLFFAMSALVLFITGAGRLSLDARFETRARPQT